MPVFVAWDDMHEYGGYGSFACKLQLQYNSAAVYMSPGDFPLAEGRCSNTARTFTECRIVRMLQESWMYCRLLGAVATECLLAVFQEYSSYSHSTVV